MLAVHLASIGARVLSVRGETLFRDISWLAEASFSANAFVTSVLHLRPCLWQLLWAAKLSLNTILKTLSWVLFCSCSRFRGASLLQIGATVFSCRAVTYLYGDLLGRGNFLSLLAMAVRMPCGCDGPFPASSRYMIRHNRYGPLFILLFFSCLPSVLKDCPPRVFPNHHSGSSTALGDTESSFCARGEQGTVAGRHISRESTPSPS